MTVRTCMANLGRISKLSLLAGLLWAAACTPAATATSTAEPSPLPALTATHTASPVPPTSTASATSAPTNTSAPTQTRTATPTETPPPSATATETAAPTATTTSVPAVNTQPSSGDFAPTSPGRWNTSSPADNMSGCSATVLAPYGPVIIRPNADGSLGWVNTAMENYTLARLGPNLYQYAGATTRNDGLVTITVTFTSLTTFDMTRVFAPSAEPGCTHTYNQTGVFEFAVP